MVGNDKIGRHTGGLLYDIGCDGQCEQNPPHLAVRRAELQANLVPIGSQDGRCEFLHPLHDVADATTQSASLRDGTVKRTNLENTFVSELQLPALVPSPVRRKRTKESNGPFSLREGSVVWKKLVPPTGFEPVPPP